MLNFVKNTHNGFGDSGYAVDTGKGLLPIVQIVCIGRNYADHAHEQGADVPERPMVFMKNIGALCVSGDEIVIPSVAREPENRTDFEAELGVMLGQDARDVSEDDALSFVLGYVPSNDISARWWQKEGSGGQFCLGKSFDTFCPVGASLIPASEVDDPQDLEVSCVVNGETMQRASTGQMMFSVARLISLLSRGTTLRAGTLILTGTPSGVGMARDPKVWLNDGDVVEVGVRQSGARAFTHSCVNRVRFGD